MTKKQKPDPTHPWYIDLLALVLSVIYVINVFSFSDTS